MCGLKTIYMIVYRLHPGVAGCGERWERGARPQGGWETAAALHHCA